MASEDQAAVLENQKKQCPFCKIIKGNIPSKKIFESEDHDKSKGVLAVLDINPAAEGHVLVMPREHYPILPLIPTETFEEIFSVGIKIADIEKILFLKQGTTIFIANGGAAGQQSSHFMIHVIARDELDLKQFDLYEKDVEKEKLDEIYKTLASNLPLMLKSVYNKFPLRDENNNPIPLKQHFSKEQVINIIGQNPQLKEALIQEPSEFKKAIPSNNQLKMIFETVDADEIIKHFVPNFNEKPSLKPEVKEAEFIDDKEDPPKAPEKKETGNANLDLVSRMFK